jgi:hypothetical protein
VTSAATARSTASAFGASTGCIVKSTASGASGNAATAMAS